MLFTGSHTTREFFCGVTHLHKKPPWPWILYLGGVHVQRALRFAMVVKAAVVFYKKTNHLVWWLHQGRWDGQAHSALLHSALIQHLKQTSKDIKRVVYYIKTLRHKNNNNNSFALSFGSHVNKARCVCQHKPVPGGEVGFIVTGVVVVQFGLHTRAFWRSSWSMGSTPKITITHSSHNKCSTSRLVTILILHNTHGENALSPQLPRREGRSEVNNHLLAIVVSDLLLRDLRGEAQTPLRDNAV